MRKRAVFVAGTAHAIPYISEEEPEFPNFPGGGGGGGGDDGGSQGDDLTHALDLSSDLCRVCGGLVDGSRSAERYGNDVFNDLMSDGNFQDLRNDLDADGVVAFEVTGLAGFSIQNDSVIVVIHDPGFSISESFGISISLDGGLSISLGGSRSHSTRLVIEVFSKTGELLYTSGSIPAGIARDIMFAYAQGESSFASPQEALSIFTNDDEEDDYSEDEDENEREDAMQDDQEEIEIEDGSCGGCSIEDWEDDDWVDGEWIEEL